MDTRFLEFWYRKFHKVFDWKKALGNVLQIQGVKGQKNHHTCLKPNKVLHLCSILLILSFFGNKSFSQSLISPAGLYTSTASGSINSSIGEPIVKPFPNSTFKVTSGFQQNLVIPLFAKPENDRTKIYPNPTPDKLTVEVYNDNQQVVKLTIIDTHGRLLLTKEFNTNSTELDLGNLVSGTYYLRKCTENDKCYSYLIIKI